jgi:Mg2+/Co2+ transporter CorB
MGYVFWNWVGLVILLVVSGFFSSSETGMMSINRYRLQHKVRKGEVGALRVHRLLKRPDRLLGVILLGNTFANICASAIATTLADSYFPDFAPGVILSSLLLTFLVLIFSETAPKTFAALYPERVSYAYSPILLFLLKVFYPLVWFVNLVANGLLSLFAIRLDGAKTDALTLEELKTLVSGASGKIGNAYQSMLSRILKLDKITIEQVMVPKGDVFAIDIAKDWELVRQELLDCRFSCVPLYDSVIDNLVGVVHRSLALEYIARQKLHSIQELRAIAIPPSYIPAAAEVSQQLMLFQSGQGKLACVVDEYANLVGVVSQKDLLDEVVGKVVSGVPEFGSLVKRLHDGSLMIAGHINLLDLDRMLGSDFASLNSATLSGLLTEWLEMIPVTGLGVRILGYPMEIVEVVNNVVKRVRLYPDQKR